MSSLEKYGVINDLGEFRLDKIEDEEEQLDENCQFILHYQKRDTGFSNKLWEFKLYDTDGKPKGITKKGWCAASSFETESAWNPQRAFVDITDPKGNKETVIFWYEVSPALVIEVVDKINQLSAFADWRQVHQQEEIDELKDNVKTLEDEVKELWEKIKSIEQKESEQ